MKTFKFLMPFLLVAFTFVGCNTDDLRNDIDELKNRVESLEALVSTMNDNVNALKVFAEGGVTISSYEKVGDTYKLVLSDGRTIELTQGKQGDVDVPTININENNEWVVNGNAIEGSVAKGDDAKAPQFNIQKDNDTGKAYWYVDYNDGKGYVQVKDLEGNPVEATTSDNVNIEPDFFEKVEVENGCMVVTLKTDPKGPYSLPIVEGLICKIETKGVEEYKDNILTVGYGRKVTLQVEVTGETQILTAPAGWTAELGALTDGKGELTITAPQAPVTTSRAVADNTKDVVLQTNKGMNWAVAKIQVEAKQLIESYYDEFDSGNDIVIGEILNENLTGEKTVKINKTMYSNIVKVEQNDYTITDDGIYFISSNVTGLTLSPTNIQNVALISDKPGVNVDCTVSAFLKIAGTGNGFIAKNINFKETEKLNYFAQATEDNVNLTNFVLDNCSLAIRAGKNFMNVATSDNLTITNVNIDNLLLVNNSINIASAGWSATRIFNYNNAPMKITDLLVANNKFYSYTENVDGAVNGCIVYANNQNVDAKIRVLNNTFVNVIFNSQPAIIGKLLSNVDFAKNIIFINTLGTSTAGSCNIMNVQNESDHASYSITDNLYYRSVATFTLTHYHSNSKYTDGIKENSMDSNPFEGGHFDLAAGTFVPNPTYSSYGAKFE